MKASFTLQSAKDHLKVLLSMLCLVFVIFPEFAAAAQTKELNQPLVFEVKNPKVLENQNQNSLSFEEITQSDPLTIKLKEYLEKHNSPLAEYADQIPQNPQWQ
jgi:hypothetical protein